MDMIYSVNKKPLGINDILQLMSFLIGEGEKDSQALQDVLYNFSKEIT